MKYLPTPDFASKISGVSHDDVGKLGLFIHFVESNDRQSLLLDARVQQVSEDIYVYRASDDLKVLFSFANDDKGEYLVFLDILSRESEESQTINKRPNRRRTPANVGSNPLKNHAINPNFNSHFNPKYNTALNPTFNSRLNPAYNSAINPMYNSSINPKFNSRINPMANSAINPLVNWTINPVRNTSLGGPFIYDLHEAAIGFVVKVNEEIVLAFNLAGRLDGFAVHATDEVSCYFDPSNKWNEYWVATPNRVSLRFDRAGAWIGFVS